MKSAKSVAEFPYSSKLICYIEVSENGSVTQIDNSYHSAAAAYKSVLEGKSKIFAVWPGKYRSDLFSIDDLSAFADAFGVSRPDDHKHKIEWEVSDYDDGKSRYAHVDLVFRCGCVMDDNNILKISRDLREQFGWDMATTTGWGSHGDGNETEYSISVRRTSLK